MTDPINNSDHLPEDEIARRRKILDDYLRMATRIPLDLQSKLESLLIEDMKAPLMELLLFSVQFGRVLQQDEDSHADASKPLIVMPDGKTPSNLLLSLVGNIKH